MIVNNLVKITESNKQILGPISFAFDSNKVYGIVGKSGSGKTTFLKCLVGLETNFLGEIKFRNSGFVAQNYSLLSRKTVIQNVMLGYSLLNGFQKCQNLKKTDHEKYTKKALELLDYVGILDKKNQYPKSLSGGEKQRVAIARAMLLDPEVIVCDEFTSALDPKTITPILDLLKSLNKTIIFVTHDFEVVKNFADIVLVIDKGIIIESSKTVDIFKHPKHEITASMIDEYYKISLPKHFTPKTNINDKNENYDSLYKLDFLDSKVTSPVISWIVSTFCVPVNIVSGNLDYIQGEAVGHLIISVPYDFDLKNALLEKNIEVEFLGHINWSI